MVYEVDAKSHGGFGDGGGHYLFHQRRLLMLLQRQVRPPRTTYMPQLTAEVNMEAVAYENEDGKGVPEDF